MQYFPVIKVMIAALIIAFSSWLSNKKPELAGFIVALPLISILALFFSYIEFKDTSSTITFAKSIFVGIPISYLFFLPFFFAEKFHTSFWVPYITGILLLIAGFFAHQAVMQWLK